MPIVVVTIIILGMVFAVVSRKKKDGGGNWVRFLAKGNEEGFSAQEVEMLRQIAIQCNFNDPVSLFISQKDLDRCIYTLIGTLKMAGRNDDPGIQDFLSRLYDYRKKLEMDKPSIRNGITTSRQMTEGQFLKILVVGAGVFKSQVVKITSQYMTISRPVNDKATLSVPWAGTKISVYFWKEDDAGYVFDTEVLDEVFSLGLPSLKIAHGDSLFRTQKRRSIRIKMHKAAFLYLIPDTEPPHQLETAPGLKCFLEDVSDTGCAVTVGGKADAGLRVKVQFALDNAAVCMSGVVRSTNFREETNRTVLHIEAEPLSVETRNRILGEMFGMMPDDDELPFRVLDGEMENLGMQENSVEKTESLAAADNSLSNDMDFDLTDENLF